MGQQQTPWVLRYGRDRAASAVCPPSSGAERDVCWRRRADGASRVIVPA